MMNKELNIKNFSVSNDSSLFLISGPCQLETEQHAMDMAGKIKDITSKFNMGFVYKTSFDKANRTSLKGKRGAGLEQSLPVFDKIKKEFNIPILTDIHNAEQCSVVSNHVDVLQIPAFLCRQTDLLVSAAKTNKIINVKKGQFLAPWDMVNVTKKISDSGNNNILITESGIIAAAHLSGPGNVKKYLRNYGDEKFDLGDINGTKISDYMKTFKGYDLSKIKAVRKPEI